MESVKDSEYSYIKALLYPPGGSPLEKSRPYGTADIEILGNKGSFNVKTGFVSRFRETNPEFELVTFLRKNTTGERFRIGRINGGSDGRGNCLRTFSDAGLKAEKLKDGETQYKLLIIAARYGSVEEGAVSQILLEGSFKIPFEIRDERVVGFKKEAKVEKTASQLTKERNPLFQGVEPFEPPIPNSVWWRISVQPSIEYSYYQQDYCPRRKSSKAVY